ncbi:MAG: hypothetical protein ACI8UO_006530 [Verrucomicrobiales bacterium]|jgi:hypothetical protein
MQPLISLKSFLAVLLILIVTAALLVAYFRDYSPGAAGHHHAVGGHGTVPKPPAAQSHEKGDQTAEPTHPHQP